MSKGVVFVSPTEPPPISSLGTTSSLPESKGVDILLVGDWGMFGIQRKEVKDLVASLRDERMSTCLRLMKHLDHGAWIIEGKWNWTQDGESLVVKGFRRTEYQGVVFSLHYQGYWVIVTDNAAHTCEVVDHLERWLEKGEHNSLFKRPKPGSEWGRGFDSKKDQAIHLLQGVESISLTLAERIYDYFGHLPLAWTVPRWKLEEVKGVGKKRAELLWAAFGGLEMEAGDGEQTEAEAVAKLGRDHLRVVRSETD